MRQLVQLHDSLPMFDALNTDIIAVALEESDPAKLARVPKLVGKGITFVANAGGRADGKLAPMSSILVDKEGIVRTVLPGIVQARAPTSLILAQLSEMTGQPIPSRDQLSDDGELGPINVRWAWSHDSVGPNDRLKLIFFPELGEGVALSAAGENKLSVSLELPEGLELVTDFELPRGKGPDGIQGAASVYRGDVPLGALELRGTSALNDGEITVRVTLRSAMCTPRGCHEPEDIVFDLPISTSAASKRRQELYMWAGW